MKRTVWVAAAVAALVSTDLRAQDAAAVIAAASEAMGAARVRAVEYAGTGSTFGFGQAMGPGAAWPRFTMTSYTAAINYDTAVMREQVVRIDDEDPPRGGGAGPYNPRTHQGGIRPIPFGPETRVREVTDRTDTGLLQIWMTPHGFLKAAAANDAVVTSAPALGTHTVSFTARGKYTVTGTINRQNLAERVETRIPNDMLGDMLVEVVYADYKDFGGIRFPTRIIQRQGGFHTLELAVADVEPNGPAAAALQPPAAPPAGSPAPERAEAKEIARGLWTVGGGPWSSYLIEFADHVVVVEAPGDEARSAAVLAEARRVLPGKPVRYVVNTHHHSDHAGGLRGYAAEGITIITHALNKPYYDQLFGMPRLLEPDRLARSGRRPAVEAVEEKRVLSDGTRTVELHHMRDNVHDPAMLMVYLPETRMVIQTDAFNPRPAEAPPLPAPSPYTVNLLENIERLQLDVEQILHIHNGAIDPFEALVTAAGRSGTRN